MDVPLFWEELTRIPGTCPWHVVDLRTRHVSYWNQFKTPDPRVSNSERLTYHQWCALPVRAAHAIHPPYTLPKYMYLDLPHHVLRNIARFRLQVHTLQIEQAVWCKSTSPVCDTCVSDDIQDEKDVMFRRSDPQVCSLRQKLSLTSLAQLLFSTSPRLPQDALSKHHSPCEFAGLAVKRLG
eukprot:1156120-Pelagomonas_calceolata.AAC.7